MFIFFTIHKAPTAEVSPQQISSESSSIANFLSSVEPEWLVSNNAPFSLKFHLAELSPDSFRLLTEVPDGATLHLRSLTLRISERVEKKFPQYFVSRAYTQKDSGIAPQISTRNQHLVESMLIEQKNIPEQYICELSGVVMDNPVRLPIATEFYCEFAAIIAHFNLKAEPDGNSIIYSEAGNNERYTLTVDADLKQYLDKVFAQTELVAGLIEKINACLDIDEERHQSYLCHYANPYGATGQARLGCYPESFFKRIQNPGLPTQSEAVFGILKLNYPSKTQTKIALQRAYAAILKKDKATFEEIVDAYPSEARQYFYAYAKTQDFDLRMDLAMPRPFNDTAEFLGEPHKKRLIP